MDPTLARETPPHCVLVHTHRHTMGSIVILRLSPPYSFVSCPGLSPFLGALVVVITHPAGPQVGFGCPN